MRYFLVSFTIRGKNSLGSIMIESNGFPSHSAIQQNILERLGYSVEIVVLTFFEFSSKEDFDNYLQ